MYKTLITTKEITHVHDIIDYIETEDIMGQFNFKDSVW